MKGLEWISGGVSGCQLLWRAWNGFWAWMGLGLEWLISENIFGSSCILRSLTFSSLGFRYGLQTESAYRFPLDFLKSRKYAFKFFKKSTCNQTHTRNKTHTHNTQKEPHTWFLPSTGDACSSTGLHWGITLNNCSTGEIFGNSIKPDTSHDNHWLN